MWRIAFVLLACTACTDDGDFGALGRAWPVSDQGIEPSAFAGNFGASDDDEVCYELDRLAGWGVTEEMRGFKLDPPESTTRTGVEIIVEQPSLGWVTAPDYAMLGVIVKGADAYNLYAYRDSDATADGHLHAPYKNDHIPAISHYNFCVVPAPPDTTGDQGCTPGYWRNHIDRWAGVVASDDFDGTFGVNAFSPNITLGSAVNLGGGGVNALARHGTAALLNAYGGIANPDDGLTVAYPLPPAKVLKLVRTAIANGTFEATAAALAKYNELGCPLHGTPAT